MLGVVFLGLLLEGTLSFELPDISVDTDLSEDNHQELHNSLLNSDLRIFEFNLNLGSVSLGLGILLLILILALAKKQNKLIENLGKRLYGLELKVKKITCKQDV